MIRTKGDLLKLAREGKFHVIVQGCNCFCTMGSGIARQIREEYPDAYNVDLKTANGSKEKLGTYSVMLGKQFNIVNAYTQYYFNRGSLHTRDVFEYDAFEKILATLAVEYKGCNFGFPYIGMGLAGGDSARIIASLEAFSEVVEAAGGTVTLVEFAQ